MIMKPLAEWPEGNRLTVVDVDLRKLKDSGRLIAKLAALGIVAGTDLTFVQKRPMPVIRVNGTKIAIDGVAAAAIMCAPRSP